MFPSAHARHSQIAYVTSDLDRALAVWRDQYDVPAFFVFTNDSPGLESSHPYQLKIALANVGGTEIELIEPLHGGLDDFSAHMASLDPTAHPVVWSGGMGELMRFAYTDERATLGHYVEHVWFDADFHGQMASAIPVWPAR